MRILLDTQCWLWMQVAPEKLSKDTRSILTASENELFLSAASSWEIAIKWSLGKLPLPVHPRKYVPSRMVSQGVDALAVRHRHVLQVADLPPHHRDPFDRLLVVQAQTEKLRLLTSDRRMGDYDVDLIWA